LSLARSLLLAIVLVAECGSAAADKDNIVKLNKYNFDQNVKHGKWFVKFFAPWCTHCQRMAPIWEQLADQAVGKEWPVKIAEVDCTVSGELCKKAQIKGFPTMALITDGSVRGKYQGEVSVQHFEAWLGKQKVLQAQQEPGRAEQEGTRVVGEEVGDSGKRTAAAATHGQAVNALVRNFLTRFPTKSKIINLYFYGGIFLCFVVGVLMFAFRVAEDIDKED